jgi:hypothetical protein
MVDIFKGEKKTEEKKQDTNTNTEKTVLFNFKNFFGFFSCFSFLGEGG